MHERFSKEGLVCLSLSVDDPGEKGTVLEFLRSKKARFQNFLLDEDPKVLEDHWNTTSVPALFVYDRQGKRSELFRRHQQAEELVLRLLKK